MDPEPVCKHEGLLGEMRATLKAQSEADARIETNLKELVTAIQKDRDTASSHYTELKDNFTKIKEILTEQKKASEDHANSQKEIKSSLDNLTSRVTVIESDVGETKKNLDSITETAKGHEERIQSIERLVIRIAAIATAVVGIIEFASKFDDIKYFIFPELKKGIEQVQEK